MQINYGHHQNNTNRNNNKKYPYNQNKKLKQINQIKFKKEIKQIRSEKNIIKAIAMNINILKNRLKIVQINKKIYTVKLIH